ncbi:hypothetical protein Unana1_06779 [Umbelopsis nana]
MNDLAMQSQDDIVKAILDSMHNPANRNHDQFPSLEQALFQARQFIGAPLNELAAKNWDQFASANYFDESGMFLATVYSLPLILNCVLALVLVLRATCTMLVNVKRAQLQRQAKAMKASSKKTD